MKQRREQGMKYFYWYYAITVIMAIAYTVALIWLVRDIFVAPSNSIVRMTYYSALGIAFFPTVGSIYLVFNLKKFKKSAYKVNLALIIYMIISCVINLLSLYLTQGIVIDDEFIPLRMIVWLMILSFWILTFIYFCKRKNLFNNVTNQVKEKQLQMQSDDKEVVQEFLYNATVENDTIVTPSDNKPAKELKKQGVHKGLKLIITVLICIGYVIALTIEALNLTPYSRKEVYISQQNVPHSVNMGIKFSEFDGFSYDYHSNRAGTNVRYVSTLNIPIALTELAVTTAIPTALMFLMYRKRKSNDNS